jgi:glutamate-1-semialdehyde aminotransferase
MLANGVWLAPSKFEAAFISDAKIKEDLAKALEITEWSFKKIKK